jgi:hypothetical protein
MHKVEQNCTHKKIKPTKCPKFKCNTISVSFSACKCSLVVFSSKVGREKKKKRVWRQFSEWLSAAMACLPAAISLLLLEGLFMQISGVSLTLTWPCTFCLLRVLLCTSLCYKLFPFQAHWGRWHCTHFLRPGCLFTAHVGSRSSPLSCGVFLPLQLSQAFPLLVAGRTPPLPLAQLFYLQFQEGFPSPNLRHSGCPTVFPMNLYCSYCLLLSFSFFPRWRSVCPGDYTALAQGCLWEYHSTDKLTLSASSQAIWARATGGLGTLLVS